MRPMDRFLPTYDVNEIHAIPITGHPDTVYRACRALDFSSSPVVRALFRLRGMPSATIDLGSLLNSGFILLADEPGKHLLLGLVGRFWLPTGHLIAVPPQDFPNAKPAGCAKAAWDFEITASPQGPLCLRTDPRVLCLDAYSRRMKQKHS